MLFAVGGGDLLVGRSHECDWPAGVAGLPVLTSQKVTATEPAAIDAQVRAALAEPGSSLYAVDEALLRSLEPDVILTQDLCKVCSVDLASVERVATTMTPKPRIVSLNPHTVEDILDDHLRIGRETGLEASARRAVVAMRERLFAAGERVNPFVDGPHVALLEWTDPLYIGGHWSVQLVERAGGFHMLNPTTVQPGQGAGAGAAAWRASGGREHPRARGGFRRVQARVDRHRAVRIRFGGDQASAWGTGREGVVARVARREGGASGLGRRQPVVQSAGAAGGRRLRVAGVVAGRRAPCTSAGRVRAVSRRFTARRCLRSRVRAWRR